MTQALDAPGAPADDFDPERINAAFRALDELTKPINLNEILKDPTCPTT